MVAKRLRLLLLSLTAISVAVFAGLVAKFSVSAQSGGTFVMEKSVIAGDYDGDGKFDAAVLRPSNQNWFVNRSSGGVTIVTCGAAGDVPLPGAFVR